MAEVGGLDRLHIERLVRTDRRQRGLVVAVGPLPADVLVPLGALLGGFLPAMAPLLPAGHAPLRLLQHLLGLAVVARVLHHVPVRSDQEHLQPHVDARLPSVR